MTTSSFTLPSAAKESTVQRKPPRLQHCRPGETSLTESTFIRDRIRVQVHVHAHHGVHGAEEVAVHARHGRKQVVEALERVVEDGVDASGEAGTQETREEEACGVKVSLISHL